MESEPERLNINSLVLPLLFVPSVEIFFAIALVIILLLCSALISGSEVAFFSLTTNDFERLRQDKNKAAERILHLKEKPRTLLATILIANNFVNIAIVIVSEYILRQLLPSELLNAWSETFLNFTGLIHFFTIEGFTVVFNFILTVVGVTFLLLLFGEVAPKVYARLNNIALAKFMAAPLTFLITIFRPISFLLVKGTGLIENKLAQKTPPGVSVASKEDFDEAIDLTVSREKNTQQEVDLLKSIVKFGEVAVKQIMRSRVDVVAVDLRSSFPDLLKIIRESGYSRLPVYEEDFDNVTGILYVKDLIGELDEPDNFEWQQLIRTDVLYVPEGKKINELLKDFQSSRLHMAIVVDEYGGTSGIVTLEDIMEEVIGDIRDEFDDEPEILYKKIDDFTFLFEGKTMLNDMCRIVGVPISKFDEVKGEADSIAGLILEKVGFIPKMEKEFVIEDFKFKIVAANERRIEQVLVGLPK